MDDIIKKAEEYMSYAAIKCNAHYLGARISFKHHRQLGGWAIAVNALIGTGLFVALNKKVEAALDTLDPGAIYLLSGVTLIAWVAVILSSLQTFLGLADRSESNRAAAAGYERLRYRLDVFLLRYRTAPIEARDAALTDFDGIVKEFDEINRDSPPIADSLYEKAKKALRTAA